MNWNMVQNLNHKGDLKLPGRRKNLERRRTEAHNDDFDQGILSKAKVPRLYRHMAVRINIALWFLVAQHLWNVHIQHAVQFMCTTWTVEGGKSS